MSTSIYQWKVEQNINASQGFLSFQCGIPNLVDQIVQDLSRTGLPNMAEFALNIIVDAPSGFAMTLLESGTPPSLETTIIITWSQCPEYWEDLWDHRPLGLIVSEYNLLSTCLQSVVHKQRFRIPTTTTTSLTPTERRIFRLLSQGYTNSQIAQALSMQCQTIKNTLTTIYKKLDLHDRSDALLYYWSVGPYQNLRDMLCTTFSTTPDYAHTTVCHRV
ncbi:MAG: helix-turn-helix transcriptional regulator [Chloroflexota bacterium]